MFRRSNEGTRHQNAPMAMSRRAAVMAAVAVPLSVQLSVYPAVADDAVTELINAAGEKNAAFMRGDMEGWAKLVRIAPDFTLMQPFRGTRQSRIRHQPQAVGTTRAVLPERHDQVGGRSDLCVRQVRGSSHD